MTKPQNCGDQAVPLTCALTGWRYTVSDTQPPAGTVAVHPSVAFGTRWQLSQHPTRAELILALGGCLYSLYNVGLYIPQASLNPANFSNGWLLDSLYIMKDAVKHCEQVGTLCRKRYPQLVGNAFITSQNIQHWLDAIWQLRVTYEPQFSGIRADKELDTITARIMHALARNPNDEQQARIRAYVQSCADAIGYSPDSQAARTFASCCIRPQFASLQALQDTMSLLWSHAPQETSDQQRLLVAICNRIDDCLATYMAKDMGSRAKILNDMLESDAQIFERGLRAQLPKQSTGKGADWKDTLAATKEKLKDAHFSDRFALALAKIQQASSKKP